MWLQKEVSAVRVFDHREGEMTEHVLASATLVDFPQFPEICCLIPRVLDLRPTYTTERDQIEESGKWEIYVQYRHIVSRFLTDRTRSGDLFVGQNHYTGFAEYLSLFLSKALQYVSWTLVFPWIVSDFFLFRKVGMHEAEILHTALVILPIILSKAALLSDLESSDLEGLLKSWPLRVGPRASASEAMSTRGSE